MALFLKCFGAQALTVLEVCKWVVYQRLLRVYNLRNDTIPGVYQCTWLIAECVNFNMLLLSLVIAPRLPRSVQSNTLHCSCHALAHQVCIYSESVVFQGHDTALGVSQFYWLQFSIVFLQCGVRNIVKYRQCYQIIHECITQQMTLLLEFSGLTVCYLFCF